MLTPVKVARLLGIWALLLAAVWAQTAASALVDATGVSFRAARPPIRIVSLAPSLTEDVFALGDGGTSLVGDTIYCRYPAAAAIKTKIGSMLTPDLEQIVQLHPDLVLATSEGNRLATVAQLRRLGLRVFVIGDSRNFDDIANHFRVLARLLHRSVTGEAVLRRAQAQIAAARERVAGQRPVLVFYEVQSIPLVSVSSGSFIDAILRDAGGRNVAAELPGRYPRLSREAVLAANPDAILISREQAEPDAAVKDWLTFPGLAAARKRRVFAVPAHVFDTPTPMTFAAAVTLAARLLHPEGQ